MKAILTAGVALLGGALAVTNTDGSKAKPKRARSKPKATPVVAPSGKTPGVRYNPDWKRRPAGMADWKTGYIAAWDLRGKVDTLTRPDKRDLQAAKRMAMKERLPGGAAAVRCVVVTEV